MLKCLEVKGHHVWNLLSGDRGETAPCWNSSQDLGGICCPDSQVQKDFLWIQSSQKQNLESHTGGWSQPDANGSWENYSKGMGAGAGWKGGLCAISRSATWWRLSIVRLQRVSAPTARWWGTVLVGKDTGTTPSEDPPTSATCVTEK